MGHSFENAVREHLVAYLHGEVSLDELKSWLVSMTWNPDEQPDEEGIRLANEIKLSLAEHSGGFLTDALLRDDLVGIANRFVGKSGMRGMGVTSDSTPPARVRAVS